VLDGRLLLKGDKMQEIDINTWKRKDHFNFFRRMDYPIYNICFDLEISGFKTFVKQNALSLNNSLIYLSTKSINEIENFRYRVKNGKIVLHDVIHPSFACMVDGSDLFKLVTVDFIDDIFDFNTMTNKEIITQKDYFPMGKLKDRDEFIFFSSIPWITFTAIDHTITFNKDDAIPRITWGKHYKKHNSIFIPYNIQVNHMFIDGYHLGIFKEKLESNIQKIIS
jgi:chloramphenicol O-acetyltransferase type A